MRDIVLALIVWLVLDYVLNSRIWPALHQRQRAADDAFDRAFRGEALAVPPPKSPLAAAARDVDHARALVDRVEAILQDSRGEPEEAEVRAALDECKLGLKRRLAEYNEALRAAS